MAASKRPGRPRAQLPHCYYEGYLEKRSFKDKASRKLWTCLCGTTLFFFNNSKDNDYLEKLELSGFISLTDDCSRDRNLGAAKLNLRMKGGEIKITAPSLETRELWKGFIYAAVKLLVPSSLNLLPGQVHMMRETVEKERDRRESLSTPPAAFSTSPATSSTPPAASSTPPATSSTPPAAHSPPPAAECSSNLYLSLVGDMPACYQPVSRTEAEMMLERNPERGTLLLRPGRDGASLALTTRQDLNGSVFRHYRVTRKHDGGYTIDVEFPIHCATLHDVINSLVEKTGGILEPFVQEGSYEEIISYVQENEESGEKSLRCASSCPLPPLPPGPPLPPKPEKSPRERVPTPELPAESEETEDSLYLNDPRNEREEEAVGLPPPTRFRLPMTVSLPNLAHWSGAEDKKKALLPPNPPPRLSNPPPPTTTTTTPTPTPREHPEGRTRRLTVGSVPTDPLAQIISEELKLKLEKRLKLEK